jgi:hypothetical protein
MGQSLSGGILKAFLASICLALAGCMGPGDAAARRDFAAEYPGLLITDCVAGEGNSDAVWYNFRFTDKSTGRAGEMQVLYTWDATGQKWKHEKIADKILPQ